MFNLLDIKDPSFVKDLSIKQLKILCQEIREFLIENISKTGGHLSSNLGVVEITVAMYYVFDPEKDKFLFDVGHQSYIHKILTGRAKDFTTLRQLDGLSGYISRKESKYDIWESGHSSTSISAMAGLLYNESSKNKCVTLIGDSSIVNGVALEGLNYLGQEKDRRAIVILNDNKMGISKSVGALSRTFAKLRGSAFNRGLKALLTKIFPQFIVKFCHRIKRSIKGFVQRDNIFEDMGFDYYGPYDGNDIKSLIKLFDRVKKHQDQPVLLHLLTKKGKGYKYSEEDMDGSFHGVPPFDVSTGKPLKNSDELISYSKMVSNYLVKKRENKEFTVITPAMKSGSMLNDFAEKYPNNFIDVGIAEEHAAVMSAGMALTNKKVVLLMYSTFAQRAFDQFLNDISRQNLNVVIGIDRAGIVGEDGSTHQGIYDLSMFMMMPNIIVTNPKDEQEVIGLFNYALDQNKPMVIRYPKDKIKKSNVDYSLKLGLEWDFILNGTDINIISYGNDLNRLEELIRANNISANLINAKSIKPIDIDSLDKIFNNKKPILIIEQAVSSGILYNLVLDYKEKNNYNSKVYSHSFDVNTIIMHGNQADVFERYNYSNSSFLSEINKIIKE